MISKSQEEIMSNWKESAVPVVSVLCNAYNHEKYVGQCLDRALMQETNFPFEIVVHDDASTDSTADIIKKYHKKYPGIIRPILQQENIYSRLDAFFDAIYLSCKGEYIATCECDDYWTKKNKLQMQYDFLSRHKDYVACGHLTKTMNCQSHKKVTFINSKPGDYTNEAMSKWQFFAHYSSLFMKNIFRDLGEEDKRNYLAVRCPWDRTLPLLLRTYGKLYVIDQYASVYRYMSTQDSFSRKHKKIQVSKTYMDCIECEKYAVKNGLVTDFKEGKEDILILAFLYFLTLKDVKSFGKILKQRKQIGKDLWICLIKTFPYIFKELLRRRRL